MNKFNKKYDEVLNEQATPQDDREALLRGAQNAKKIANLGKVWRDTFAKNAALLQGYYAAYEQFWTAASEMEELSRNVQLQKAFATLERFKESKGIDTNDPAVCARYGITPQQVEIYDSMIGMMGEQLSDTFDGSVYYTPFDYYNEQGYENEYNR